MKPTVTNNDTQSRKRSLEKSTSISQEFDFNSAEKMLNRAKRFATTPKQSSIPLENNVNFQSSNKNILKELTVTSDSKTIEKTPITHPIYITPTDNNYQSIPGVGEEFDDTTIQQPVKLSKTDSHTTQAINLKKIHGRTILSFNSQSSKSSNATNNNNNYSSTPSVGEEFDEVQHPIKRSKNENDKQSFNANLKMMYEKPISSFKNKEEVSVYNKNAHRAHKKASAQESRNHSFKIGKNMYLPGVDGFQAKFITNYPENYQQLHSEILNKDNKHLEMLSQSIISLSREEGSIQGLKLPKKEPSFSNLGNYDSGPANYFNSSPFAEKAAKKFLTSFFNYEDTACTFDELDNVPCLSFVHVNVKGKDYCLVAVSGATTGHVSSKQVDFWQALNDTAKYLSEQGNIKFFMLDGATFELDSLIAEILRATVGNIHNSLGKSCSEKAFTASLMKLLGSWGSDVKVQGIRNYRMALSDRNSEHADVIDIYGKKYYISTIPCCDSCKQNKIAVMTLLTHAQELGDTNPSRQMQRVPSSPRADERELFDEVARLYAENNSAQGTNLRK